MKKDQNFKGPLKGGLLCFRKIKSRVIVISSFFYCLLYYNKHMKDNLHTSFFEMAEKNKDKVLFLDKKGNDFYPLTYGEVSEKVKIFSAFLLKQDLEPIIAILAENSSKWAVADLGAQNSGWTVVPIHTTLTLKDITYILNDSKASILCVSGQQMFDKIKEILAKVPSLKRVIAFDPVSSQKIKIIPWDEIMEQKEKAPVKEHDPDSVFTIIYTSGTTGDPKGVLLSHKNILHNIVGCKEIIDINSKDVLLSTLPFSHSFQRTARYYTPLLSGATIAFNDDIKNISENLAKIKPTILICVPRIFEKTYQKIWEKSNSSKFKKTLFLKALKVTDEKKLLKKFYNFLVFRKIRKAMGGRLRFAVSGGASLNPKIIRFFKKIGIVIIEGYGLTEASPIISANKLEDVKIGSVGKALSGVEVKLAEDKELLVKGDNVMKGYHNLPSTDIMTKDGWLKTGDLAFIDNEGFIIIIGRKKEIIVLSNGKNIAPEKIETLLNSSNYIINSCVINDSKKELSALIFPDLEKFEETAKIKEVLRQEIEKTLIELPDHEKVKRFVLIDSDFTQENNELTPTLKLKRHTIYEHHKDVINEMD